MAPPRSGPSGLYQPRAVNAISVAVREPTTLAPFGLSLAELGFYCLKQQPIPSNTDPHRRGLLFRA